MTIFSTPRVQREDMGVHEFSTGLGDVIGASAREAVHEMPSVQLGDMAELAAARGDFEKAPFSDPLGAGLDPVGAAAIRQRQPDTIPRIAMTEAKAKVKDAGLDKALTLPDGEDMSSPALDIMMERARGRQERASTIARGPSGIIPTALSVGTSFAVGALDPVNIAAAFIPVVGEARYAKLLADAAGTLPATVGERLAARAGIGAASGAVGMAAIEPIAAYAKTQEGQDYTFAHALRSVIFGAFLGSALHTGGGAIADALRSRAGRPLYPFDIGEPLEFHTPWDELKLPPAGAPRLPAESPEGDAIGRPPVSQAEQAAAPVSPEGDLAAREALPQAPSRSETTVTVNGETRTLKTEWDPAEIAAAHQVSPAVATIDDLPPRAREDAMRGAVAALVQGEPVRVGEMIEAGAKADPRIAESVDAGHVQAVTGAADFSDAGKAVFTDIRRQLTDQGIGPDIADANAAVFAARYEARAARLEGAGGTAEDLYRAEGVEIRRNSVEDAFDGRIYAQRRGRDELAGQMDLGGTGPISDAELAQRRADQALKPKVAQRPMDEGLFGDTAQQTDLVDMARQKGGQRELFQPPTVPTFYSAVERAIGNVKMEKASPDQWLATIRNTPGVKAEELEWLGIADWLKEQDGPVTRQQLQDYVRANAIEVKEVGKGAGFMPDANAAARALNERLIAKYGGLEFERMTPEELSEFDRVHSAASGDESGIVGATRHDQWQLPGGENYRELLLTLPERNAAPQPIDTKGWHVETKRNNEFTGQREITIYDANGQSLGQRSGFRGTDEEAIRDAAITRQQHKTVDDKGTLNFRKKEHFDEWNVIAHVRFNDRVIDGKRALFIEEVQSDWHQKGKREGYQGRGRSVEDIDRDIDAIREEAIATRPHLSHDDATAGDWQKFWDSHPEMKARQDALYRERGGRQYAVPDAPFKTTWPELSLKRMIRYAAENGYDKIAWTSGETQAERYDLSKQISRIRVHGDGDNLRVSAWDHSNTNVMDLRHATRESLPDIIGKEAADKVLSQPEPKGNYGSRTLEGLDLKVGGEGMKGFYDKILPATVSKLTKRYGGKVEEASVKDTGEAVQRYDGPAPTPEQMNAVELAVHARPTQQTYTSPITGARQMFLLNRVANQQPLRAVRERMRDGDMSFQRAMSLEGTQELAEIFGGHIVQDREARSTPAHTLDITPELRKAAVEQGFPLFQGGERGRITLADNKAIIDLFRSADRSTLMHEAGHLWLDELARDAARVNAPAGIREDMATVLKWLGAERPDAITTEQHEKWAQGFEQYLASGEAPTPALQSAFQKFKDWLVAIYKSITAIGEPIPPEIRAVFDRMVATPEQLGERAGEAAGGNVVKLPAKRGPAARDPATFSLLEFIASRGGLRNDDPLIGDVRGSIGRPNRAVPGFGSLIRQPTELSTAARMGGRHAPMTLDQAREAAIEAGYLRDNGADAGRESTTDVRTLLDAIDRELRGQKVYREGHERAERVDADQEAHYAEQHAQAVAELREQFTAEGIDPKTVPDATLARVLEIMRREGESDPLNAYERALMEEGHDASEAGQHQRTPDHIPGWDTVSHDAGPAPERGGELPRRGQLDQGGPARAAGGSDRAAAERDTWSRLADTTRDFNEPDVVAASKRAEQLPEPESLQPSKRLAAAQKAEAEAQAAYEAAIDYLPADLRNTVEQELRRIDQDALDTSEVLRRGAACLAAGVAEAVA